MSRTIRTKRGDRTIFDARRIILDVSCEAYQEIRRLLVAANCDHAIEGDEAGEVIDMSGVALSEDEPAPTEVKTLQQYSDPTPGTPTAIKITCSCVAPDVGLETAATLSRVNGSEDTPTVELVCHYCGASILIVRHDTTPDEYFRKGGHEPETGGR